MSNNISKINIELDKLLNSVSLKLLQNSIDQKVILIDFVKEYNKIWREDDKKN